MKRKHSNSHRASNLDELCINLSFWNEYLKQDRYKTYEKDLCINNFSFNHRIIQLMETKKDITYTRSTDYNNWTQESLRKSFKNLSANLLLIFINYYKTNSLLNQLSTPSIVFFITINNITLHIDSMKSK